jgi:signal transduction histidine kinase
MPRGGRLRVRAGWAGTGDPVRAPRRRAANRVKIEIEDTGIGIQPSDTDRVFNPFYTTRDSGTGLGLALAHKIIEDHGGVISFESVSGRGTTFTIVLSLIPDPPGMLGDETSR